MHLRELDANLIVILDALLLEASVTKAAARLGRSPSAVSHALARLREVFDDPLFIRAGQRLVPTSRATQLAPTVHIIVSGLEGLLRRESGFDPRAQNRTFDVACRGDLELTLLPAVRAALEEFAPGIALARSEEYGIVEGLRAGRIQLAIIEGAADASATDISLERLLEDPCIAIAPEDYGPGRVALLRAEGPPVFADAAQVPHLFDVVEQPRPPALETVASPLIAIHTALARRGVALVPASVGAIACRHMCMRLVTTDLHLPSLRYDLAWHLSMERDECHAWLRDRLRRCSDELQERASPALAELA
jgi:DNA-binding transcriptional LysR family regulator